MKKQWVNDYWNILTNENDPVAFIDEKCFYTTNRRKKVKHLPASPSAMYRVRSVVIYLIKIIIIFYLDK